MGAATAIFLASNSIHVDAMILDSPFGRLRDVVENIVSHHSNIPGFIIKAFMGVLRGTIQEKADFDIDKVNPFEYAAKVTVPCLFVTGDEDYVVNFEQFMELYRVFRCEKKMFVVQGTHSDARIGDSNFVQAALGFMKEKMNLEKQEGQKPGSSVFLESETTLSTQQDDHISTDNRFSSIKGQTFNKWKKAKAGLESSGSDLDMIFREDIILKTLEKFSESHNKVIEATLDVYDSAPTTIKSSVVSLTDTAMVATQKNQAVFKKNEKFAGLTTGSIGNGRFESQSENLLSNYGNTKEYGLKPPSLKEHDSKEPGSSVQQKYLTFLQNLSTDPHHFSQNTTTQFKFNQDTGSIQGQTASLLKNSSIANQVKNSSEKISMKRNLKIEMLAGSKRDLAYDKETNLGKALTVQSQIFKNTNSSRKLFASAYEYSAGQKKIFSAKNSLGNSISVQKEGRIKGSKSTKHLRTLDQSVEFEDPKSMASKPDQSLNFKEYLENRQNSFLPVKKISEESEPETEVQPAERLQIPQGKNEPSYMTKEHQKHEKLSQHQMVKKDANTSLKSHLRFHTSSSQSNITARPLLVSSRDGTNVQQENNNSKGSSLVKKIPKVPNFKSSHSHSLKTISYSQENSIQDSKNFAKDDQPGKDFQRQSIKPQQMRGMQNPFTTLQNQSNMQQNQPSELIRIEENPESEELKQNNSGGFRLSHQYQKVDQSRGLRECNQPLRFHFQANPLEENTRKQLQDSSTYTKTQPDKDICEARASFRLGERTTEQDPEQLTTKNHGFSYNIEDQTLVNNQNRNSVHTEARDSHRALLRVSSHAFSSNREPSIAEATNSAIIRSKIPDEIQQDLTKHNILRNSKFSTKYQNGDLSFQSMLLPPLSSSCLMKTFEQPHISLAGYSSQAIDQTRPPSTSIQFRNDSSRIEGQSLNQDNRQSSYFLKKSPGPQSFKPLFKSVRNAFDPSFEMNTSHSLVQGLSQPNINSLNGASKGPILSLLKDRISAHGSEYFKTGVVETRKVLNSRTPASQTPQKICIDGAIKHPSERSILQSYRSSNTQISSLETPRTNSVQRSSQHRFGLSDQMKENQHDSNTSKKISYLPNTTQAELSRRDQSAIDGLKLSYAHEDGPVSAFLNKITAAKDDVPLLATCTIRDSQSMQRLAPQNLGSNFVILSNQFQPTGINSMKSLQESTVMQNYSTHQSTSENIFAKMNPRIVDSNAHPSNYVLGGYTNSIRTSVGGGCQRVYSTKPLERESSQLNSRYLQTGQTSLAYQHYPQ